MKKIVKFVGMFALAAAVNGFVLNSSALADDETSAPGSTQSMGDISNGGTGSFKGAFDIVYWTANSTAKPQKVKFECTAEDGNGKPAAVRVEPHKRFALVNASQRVEGTETMEWTLLPKNITDDVGQIKVFLAVGQKPPATVSCHLVSIAEDESAAAGKE